MQGAGATALVGRESVLDDVSQRLRAAGHLELVAGAPGIGKTRLIREALARQRAEGARVFIGTAEEFERTRPFQAVIDAFGIGRAAAGEFAEVATLLDPDVTAVETSLDVADHQFRVLDALIDAIERLGERTRVVIGLDDLQWADPYTLAFVRACIKRLVGAPVSLIGALRPPASEDVEHFVAACLSDGASMLELDDLCPDDVASLVSEVVGARPGASLLGAAGAAGGNPFYVIELLRALRDEGAIRLEGGYAETGRRAPPRNLRVMILRRLSFLAPGTVEVLRTASILGPSFGVADLALATGRTALDLVGVLSDATRMGVVAEADDKIVFNHALIRDALYYDIPADMRRALHSDLATALIRSGASLERAAPHIALGASPPDRRAASKLMRAARTAAARAPAAALPLFDDATRIAGPEDPVSVDAAAEAAMAMVWIGRLDGAEARARHALDSLRNTGNEARLHFALGRALFFQGRIHRAIDELERAASAPGVSIAERTRFRAELAFQWALTGALDHARTLGRAALAEAERRDDDEARVDALFCLSIVDQIGLRVRPALDYARRALDVAMKSRLSNARRRGPHLFLGLAELRADLLDSAAETLVAGRRLAEDLGVLVDLPMYHWTLAELRFHRGDWDAALSEADAGLSLGSEMNFTMGKLFALATIAEIRLRRDDSMGAEAALAEGEALVSSTGFAVAGIDMLMRVRAAFLERVGHPDRALALMSAVWDGAEGTGVRGHRPGLGPDLVRLSLEAGDLERARSTAELVADVAAAVDIDTVTGAALLCRGMVDGDRATMLDAVAVFRRGPRPVELAQACEHAGRVIGTQDAECSVALVREAIEVYEGVEAALDVARAESLLRRLGSRRGRRGRRGRPTTGWDSLTRAEMQVARHVSEGFTNPEIASRLYLSRYTVQTHLRHIFAKLNVSSRSEVAAEVTRRDASPDGPAIDRQTW